jgi:hypothetical protein
VPETETVKASEMRAKVTQRILEIREPGLWPKYRRALRAYLKRRGDLPEAEGRVKEGLFFARRCLGFYKLEGWRAGFHATTVRAIRRPRMALPAFFQVHQRVHPSRAPVGTPG